MESDFLEIIEACNGEKDIREPYSALLADCFQVSHEIPTVKLLYCPRESNTFAHFIARHAYDMQLEFSCEDEPPGFLLPHVMKDVTFSVMQ